MVLFLSIGWIVFYINTATNDSFAVLSVPLVLFSGLSAVMFLLLLLLFWRRNRSAYKRRYAQWERSFLSAKRQALKIAVLIGIGSFLICLAVDVNVHSPSAMLMFLVPFSVVNVLSVLVVTHW